MATDTPLAAGALHLARAAPEPQALRELLACYRYVEHALCRIGPAAALPATAADKDACARVAAAHLAPALLATAHASLTQRVRSCLGSSLELLSHPGDAGEAATARVMAALCALLRHDHHWLSAAGAQEAQVARYQGGFLAVLVETSAASQLSEATSRLITHWLSAWDVSVLLLPTVSPAGLEPELDACTDPPSYHTPYQQQILLHAVTLGLSPCLNQALDRSVHVQSHRLVFQACLPFHPAGLSSNQWASIVPTVRAKSFTLIAYPAAFIRFHLAFRRAPSWGSTTASSTVSTDHELYRDLVTSHVQTVDQLVLHAVFSLRLEQFQELVLAFPASIPALQDIQTCLDARTSWPSPSGVDRVDAVAQMAHTLLSFWSKGLLLPSTPTDALVEFFVLLVHACRATLAEGGQVLLSHIVPTLRATLRARPDTIDVVVAALLGKGATCKLLRPALHHAQAHLAQNPWPLESTELPLDPDQTPVLPSEDQQLNEAPPPDDGSIEEDDSDDDAAVASKAWKPRPRQAGPAYRRTGQSDVVGLLVSIFTDRQGFVSALERAFASQLLTLSSYDITEQVAGLRALKERFGSQALLNIDTMLRDLTVSSRFALNLQSYSSDSGQCGPTYDALIHATKPVIVSRQCWPDLTGEPSFFGGDQAPLRIPGWDLPSTTCVPERWQRAWELCERVWTENDTGSQRRLIPHPRLSTAAVTLTMDDGRILSFDNLDAAQLGVLEVAAKSSQDHSLPSASLDTMPEPYVTVQGIMDKLLLDRASATRALFFWSAQGVLREQSGDVFVVVEHAQP